MNELDMPVIDQKQAASKRIGSSIGKATLKLDDAPDGLKFLEIKTGRKDHKTGKPEMQFVGMRARDHFLLAGLTPEQERAISDISYVYRHLVRGATIATMNPIRVDEGRNSQETKDINPALIDSFMKWVKLVQREKIGHSLVINIIIFAISVNAIASMYRRDRRTIKGQFFKALEIWTEIEDARKTRRK